MEPQIISSLRILAEAVAGIDFRHPRRMSVMTTNTAMDSGRQFAGDAQVN